MRKMTYRIIDRHEKSDSSRRTITKELNRFIGPKQYEKLLRSLTWRPSSIKPSASFCPTSPDPSIPIFMLYHLLTDLYILHLNYLVSSSVSSGYLEILKLSKIFPL
jgi:hypothetical protein